MLLPYLLIVAIHATPADSLMTPGISHALARYRAAHVRDVRYDLDLDVTARDSATGHVRLAFTRVNGGDIIVDFRGTSFRNVAVNGRPMEAVEYNRAHMRFEAESLRDGPNTIEADFTTPIARAGASIIRFTDGTDQRDYLYTLLVPSDANLLFPCFDQPDLKAVFRLRMRVPHGWDVLSNGAKEPAHAAANGGGQTYSFAATKPIPTYLFAFAAGPYARLTNSAINSTLWVRASRAHEVEADTLIGLNDHAKRWLESYFGIPYPFSDSPASPKQIDFLLAPAFPFGGMEHPGAIFYNEESFIFREPPTLNQRLGRQATIYHEVAHQWFGDYATMRWFDDLWMKEGFATYMAAKLQAANGDSAAAANAWMSFYLRNKPAAYDVDASAGTTPVWQELGNLDQAKSNYGAIVYNKAPGVLKQLDHLVGERAFQRGVHDFLVSHAYGNGTWQELLAAVGNAAGRDLTDWGRIWFVRPGMPVIEQQLEIADGHVSRLALIQHPAQPLSGPGVWPMKIDVRLEYESASPAVLPVEIRAETTVVAAAHGLPAPSFVYANANDYGYGLFMLDARSRDYLLGARPLTVTDDPQMRGVGIRGVREPFLRAMLWGSLWDLVRDARLDPRQYVRAALDGLTIERDEQIASRQIGRVGRALEYLRPDSSTSADRVTAYAAMLRDVEDLFLRRAADSTLPYGVRKSYFDGYVGIAHTPAALARLDAWLDADTAAGMPLRQPTRWSIVTVLIARGAESGASRLGREIARDTTTGGQRRAFVAGAAFPDGAAKRAYFQRYFTDSTLNEEWVTASLGAFNADEQSAITLAFLRPALDSLPWIQRNRRIFFLGSWVNAFVGGQSSATALGVVDAYLGENPDLARDLRLKVIQARDDLERAVRIRNAFVRQ